MKNSYENPLLGGVARSARVGWFPTQPTPGPGGPRPSREGNRVAANGDSIDMTVAGSGEPTDTPGIIRITDIQTINGGTGRFAGAQGSFTVERLASAVTFLTSGSFHGTITSPGAAH